MLAALTLTGGGTWGPRDCPFLKMIMPHSPRGDSRALPSAPGMDRVGSKAGTAPVLAGQGRLADVGSDTDVAQERSSPWY